MMRVVCSLFCISTLVRTIAANVEKTIFLGPSAIQIPRQHPTIADLQLQTLTPDASKIRANVTASFSSPENPDGTISWYLLEGLTTGQRYEVRICWAATQPTSFSLDTYELPEVFDTSVLVSSLSQYAQKQLSRKPMPHVHPSAEQPLGEDEQSILLLRISAAADYYTMNKALMKDVPDVLVDIILDPFVFNVLPRSLIPTGIHLMILAILGWFLSGQIVEWLTRLIRDDGGHEKTE